MLLQTGKFMINNMSEIDNIDSDKEGIKKVIDLDYMGQRRPEIDSMMRIENSRLEYDFFPMNIYDKDNKQLYIYFNKEILKEKREDYLQRLFEYIYLKEDTLSLFYYINGLNDYNKGTNFWWNVTSDYILFFGEEKKEKIGRASCRERV